MERMHSSEDMHAISAPRREFDWTRIRATPNEPAIGGCKRSAELLPVPTRLAISPPAEAASGPNSERAGVCPSAPLRPLANRPPAQLESTRYPVTCPVPQPNVGPEVNGKDVTGPGSAA